MTGYLYITEYNNMGDVQWETPMEPAQRVMRVAIGEVSEEVAKTTRMVLLFSTVPCLVAFVPDGEEVYATQNPDAHVFPLAPETETMRLMHMNTAMRIATYERGEDE